ncbi:MAG: hypothetical protein QOF67_37, partial [Mycobacterium sp.]|nr:hypothetical protein [Mycobacterium sp.]
MSTRRWRHLLAIAVVLFVGLAVAIVPLVTRDAATTGPTVPTTPTPTESPPVAERFPVAASTGWRHTGVSLKASGSVTVTESGAVLDSLDIKGNLEIKADNVTVRRSRITAGNFYPIRVYPGFTGLQVIDSEVVGVNSVGNHCSVAVSGSGVTLTRVDIHDCEDGFHPGSNSTIQDSFIHDLWLGTDATGARVLDTHNDGIQVLSGSHVVIRHNRIEIGHNENATVFVKADFGDISDVVIDGNYLDGGSYTIFGGDTASHHVTNVS